MLLTPAAIAEALDGTFHPISTYGTLAGAITADGLPNLNVERARDGWAIHAARSPRHAPLHLARDVAPGWAARAIRATFTL